MICISNHNIMLLATSLLRIYQNYELSGKYEIGDCLYVIVLALFYHSSYPSLYVNFVYMLIICSFCLIGEYRIQIYLSSDVSLNNRLYHVS